MKKKTIVAIAVVVFVILLNFPSRYFQIKLEQMKLEK